MRETLPASPGRNSCGRQWFELYTCSHDCDIKNKTFPIPYFEKSFQRPLDNKLSIQSEQVTIAATVSQGVRQAKKMLKCF